MWHRILFVFVAIALMNVMRIEAALESPDPFQPSFFFDTAPIDQLRASPKKVFALYMFNFPLSIDNKAPDNDYYTNGYINPYAGGVEAKWNKYGGFLRSRPWPRPPINATNFKDYDFANEVRRARSLGIDGFILDVFTATDPGINRSISVIQQVDPTFSVVFMPDFAGTSMQNNPDQIKDLVRQWKDSPIVYRTPENNGILLTPFIPDNATWWIEAKSELEREGINISVIPIPLSMPASLDNWGDSIYGFSMWGARTQQSSYNVRSNGPKVHSNNIKWLAPVAPQDFRPKSGIFSEANCSVTFRNGWDSALNGSADMVHLITWNDYSEHSIVSPSTGVRDSFYDLTAYYTHWFKTGSAPELQREAIYYFHRSQRTDSEVVQPTPQTVTFTAVNGAPGADFVEMLAFLNAPATLMVTMNGVNHTLAVEAGIQSFYVPLEFGPAPEFRVWRDDVQVLYLQSDFAVNATIQVSNYLYNSGKVFGDQLVTPSAAPVNQSPASQSPTSQSPSTRSPNAATSSVSVLMPQVSSVFVIIVFFFMY